MKTTNIDDWKKQMALTDIHPLIAFDPTAMGLLLMDFTSENKALTADVLEDTNAFSGYVSQTLADAHAQFGIGGYNEHRTVYKRSRVFDAAEGQEPRSVHLGIDIWGAAGTPIFCPINGVVHSFAFNHAFGDYGATIILHHPLNGIEFYTLYGHLSLKDIERLQVGKQISAGTVFAHFGKPEENGFWPPHLHFQVMLDMEGKKGDYPGVCSLSTRAHYLNNCPDPNEILRLMQYAKYSH